MAALAVTATRLRASVEQSQVFSAPKAQIENVSFEQLNGGVFNIYYDLISDSPNATFRVSIQVSDDGGKTFTLTPAAITGDVENVKPGRHKKIVWQSGQDIGAPLAISLLKFNVIAESGPLPPQGKLTIQTSPPGASVIIDGESKGLTPMTIESLATGTHHIVVSKLGYLENSGDATVTANSTETFQRTLTPEKPPGGSAMKWVIPVVGGGAAVALLAAHAGKSNSVVTPPPCTPSAPPTPTISDNLNGLTPIENITTVTFTGSASGTWTDSGASLASGSTTATLSLKDIQSHTIMLTVSSTAPCTGTVAPVTAQATETVQAKDLVGVWRSVDSTGAVRLIVIQGQTGTNLTGMFCLGSCTSSAPIQGTGSVTASRGITFSAVQGTSGITIDSSAGGQGIDVGVTAFSALVIGPAGSVAANNHLTLTFNRQ